MRNRNTRPSGSIVTVGLAALVPLLAGIGAIAVDLMHNNDAIGALQRASDAGALAGAQNLWTFSGKKSTSATTNNTSNEDAVNAALTITSYNVADSRSVYTDVVPGATVTATLGPNANAPTQCTVDATMPVHSLLALMFGNFNQTVNSHSVAGMGPPLDKMNGGYMPVLVSTNQADQSGTKLSSAKMNSTFTVILQDNAVWIYNPNPVDKAIIDGISDPATYPPVAQTPITVGDYIKSDNGVKSAGQEFDKLIGKTVIFPVTTDQVGTTQPNHQVIGFVALRITSVVTRNPDPSVTGTIVPAIGTGVYTGHGQDPVFTSFPFFQQGASVNTVHLIQ